MKKETKQTIFLIIIFLFISTLIGMMIYSTSISNVLQVFKNGGKLFLIAMLIAGFFYWIGGFGPSEKK